MKNKRNNRVQASIFQKQKRPQKQEKNPEISGKTKFQNKTPYTKFIN